MRSAWRLAIALVGCGHGPPVETPSGPTGVPATTSADPAPVDMMEALGYAEADPVTEDGVCGVLVSAPVGVEPMPPLWVMGLDNTPRFLWEDGHTVPDTRPGTQGVAIRTRGTPDGDLVMVRGDGVVRRVSPDGTERWARSLRAHHDLRVDDEGRVVVLTSGTTTIEGNAGPILVLEDRLTTLAPDGHTLREVPLTDAFAGWVEDGSWALAYAESWDGTFDDGAGVGARDLLHANGIDIVRTSRGPCMAGDHLVMMRNLHGVACLAPEGEVHWRWRGESFVGELMAPHDPLALPDGQIAVFDNGPGRSWSRILVFDPAQDRVTWYFGGPHIDLFSGVLGEQRLLPDGTWLINASTQREIWRVHRDGRVLWRWRACASHGAWDIHQVQVADAPPFLAPRR